ncbi:MAG: hypothetical protein J6P16_03600 [Eubacterium sp.]|nr:hypothetical protein [Eubacterium sp.]
MRRFIFLIMALCLFVTGCTDSHEGTVPLPETGHTSEVSGTVTGGAVSPDAVNVSFDEAMEKAQQITSGLSLDEKLSFMVVGYENISRIPKYFPGDGKIPDDKNGTVPQISDSLITVRDFISENYSDILAAGTDRIMMSPAAYPKISAMITSAFLSYDIVTSMLRTELGFDGVVYTPPLLIQYLRTRYPEDPDGYMAVEAVKAGCDIIYQPRDKKRAIQALRIQVNTGNMPVERIDASVVRILRSRLMHGETVPQ